MREPESVRVPVVGGTLNVLVWPGREDAPCVLAVHGITATAVSWQRIADALGPAITLVAPDLRGRGGSRDLPGPYGMAAHARDLLAVADHLELDAIAVAGHSMGGFVAPYFATLHPDRVSALVVMDGGMRVVDVPRDADIEQVLRGLVGPSLDRLRMRFGSRDEWHAFWRAHPGVAAEGWNAYVRRYVDSDAVEEDGEIRSGVSLDAVLEDSRDTLFDDDVTQAIYRMTQPLWFIRAERGALDAQPVYDDEKMAALRAAVPHAQIESLATNHFMLALGAASGIVADRIVKAARP